MPAASPTDVVRGAATTHTLKDRVSIDRVKAYLEAPQGSVPGDAGGTPSRWRRPSSSRRRNSITVEELRDHLERTSIRYLDECNHQGECKPVTCGKKTIAAKHSDEDDSFTSQSTCTGLGNDSFRSRCLTDKGSFNDRRDTVMEPYFEPREAHGKEHTELAASTHPVLAAAAAYPVCAGVDSFRSRCLTGSFDDRDSEPFSSEIYWGPALRHAAKSGRGNEHTDLAAASPPVLTAAAIHNVLTPDLLGMHNAMYADESAEAYSIAAASTDQDDLSGSITPSRLRRPPRATAATPGRRHSQRRAAVTPPSSSDHNFDLCKPERDPNAPLPPGTLAPAEERDAQHTSHERSDEEHAHAHGEADGAATSMEGALILR